MAMLVPSVLALFLSMGMGAANVYFAGSGRLTLPQLAANSTAFGLIATTIGAVLMAALALTGWLTRLTPGVPLWVMLLAWLSMPVSVFNGLFSALLQGQQRFAELNAASLGLAASRLALTVLFVVFLGWGLLGAVLAALGAGLAGLTATTWLLHRAGARFAPRWDRAVMRQTLAVGLRGYVGNVLQFFNYRLDAFLVNYLMGAAAVGIYGAAVALAELLWHLPNSVGLIMFPKASASSEGEMNRFTPRVFWVTMLLTVLGAAGVALLGPWLVDLIYGSAFAEAYMSLLVLLPGVVLLGGGKVLSGDLAGRGRMEYNSISAGAGLVVTLTLDLLLIPRWGTMGAAIASSVAYGTVLVSASLFYWSASRNVPDALP